MAIFDNTQSFLTFKKYLTDNDIKYISFDIFDTLVFRKVNKPTDIFLKMHLNKFVKKLFENASNFKQLRITAEKFARKESKDEEISIYDIYNQFTYLTKEEQAKLIKIELKTEEKYLFVNQELEHWINLAIENNKKVIFISDMYLKKEQIFNIILKKLKRINEVDDIFVSSDLKKTKQTGSMYNYLFEDKGIKPEEIIHIGDNLLTDISSANVKNIKTIYYNYDYIHSEQVRNEEHYLEYPENLLALRNLVAVNNPYKDEKSKFFYNFGATIIGPVFWSFSHWLKRVCLENTSYDLGFMLREGDIFRKYFDVILKKENIENNFSLKKIYVSRKALFLPSLSKEDYDLDYLNFSLYRNWKIKDFYNKLGLTIENNEIVIIKDKLIEEIKKSDKIFNLITDDLKKNEDKILKNKDEQLKLFLKYWYSLKFKEKFVLFDFGANSSMQTKISQLVNASFINVLFYRTKRGFENSLNQKQYTYISYSEKNKHKIELLRRSPDIFEILFNGMLSTTLGYKKVKNTIVPILDKCKDIRDETIINAFNQGIDDYFKLSFKYNQKGDIFKSDDILNLMVRVIEFPTNYEVKYLGKLNINSVENTLETITLISKESRDFLNSIGIDEVYTKYKTNKYIYWQQIPWIEGTITSIDSDFIKNKYNRDQDINQVKLDKLLKKIDQINLTEVSIYGIGEFFLNLLPELLIRNIKVKYLIETKPSKKEFMGYRILSPEEIIETNQRIFIIASVVFSSVMVEKLNSVFKQNNKSFKVVQN